MHPVVTGHDCYCRRFGGLCDELLRDACDTAVVTHHRPRMTLLYDVTSNYEGLRGWAGVGGHQTNQNLTKVTGGRGRGKKRYQRCGGACSGVPSGQEVTRK